MTSLSSEGIKTFIRHVESLENSEPNDYAFVKEYSLIQEAQMRDHRDNVSSLDIGQLESNLKKNRYKDIVPYDDHRIVLSALEDQNSDYINASKIMGVCGEGDYIAAQGPLSGTVNDFWRMIWEYNIEIVFMACRLIEMKKIKCSQYWSNVGSSVEFGDITVFTESEEDVNTECVQRSFRVTKGDEVHFVIQFHYCGWPDHGVPANPADICDAIGVMREIRRNCGVPLLIHCSAGCGRTGAIIAIDYAWTLLEEGKFYETFSLFDLVCDLRKQRMSLVQTPDQYVFVNKVVKSLCEERLIKMASHTYENVDINQEDSSAQCSQQTSKENDYEDIWTPSTVSQEKSSDLYPKEHLITDESYLGKSQDPKKMSEEENNDSSHVYENVVEMNHKIQDKEKPTDIVNKEKMVHKTFIRVNSSKESQDPDVDVIKMHSYSPPTSESSDLKGSNLLVSTIHQIEGQKSVDNAVQDVSRKTATRNASMKSIASISKTKAQETANISIDNKVPEVKEPRHEKSQLPGPGTRDVARIIPETAELQLLPSYNKKSQPVADKVARGIDKRWSSVKSHGSVPLAASSKYERIEPLPSSRIHNSSKTRSMKVASNRKVYDGDHLPDRIGLASRSTDNAKGRNGRSTSNDQISAKQSSLEDREKSKASSNVVDYANPKYQGFVLLNSKKPH